MSPATTEVAGKGGGGQGAGRLGGQLAWPFALVPEAVSVELCFRDLDGWAEKMGFSVEEGDIKDGADAGERFSELRSHAGAESDILGFEGYGGDPEMIREIDGALGMV